MLILPLLDDNNKHLFNERKEFSVGKGKQDYLTTALLQVHGNPDFANAFTALIRDCIINLCSKRIYPDRFIKNITEAFSTLSRKKEIKEKKGKNKKISSTKKKAIIPTPPWQVEGLTMEECSKLKEFYKDLWNCHEDIKVKWSKMNSSKLNLYMFPFSTYNSIMSNLGKEVTNAKWDAKIAVILMIKKRTNYFDSLLTEEEQKLDIRKRSNVALNKAIKEDQLTVDEFFNNLLVPAKYSSLQKNLAWNEVKIAFKHNGGRFLPTITTAVQWERSTDKQLYLKW
jgi:hypothetical protein